MQHSYTKEIIKLVEEQKILRAKDVVSSGIPSVYLTRMVDRGELIRLTRGLYALPDYEFNEKQSQIEVQKLVPNGVMCLLTALTFHELTTQIPFQVWLAVERKDSIPKSSPTKLRVFRMSGEAFTEGIETHDVDGVELRVYSPAKTVADCFKYRNKIGQDVALEALRDTWRNKKATMDELWHFAKVCRMSNVMRPYMESLV